MNISEPAVRMSGTCAPCQVLIVRRRPDPLAANRRAPFLEDRPWEQRPTEMQRDVRLNFCFSGSPEGCPREQIARTLGGDACVPNMKWPMHHAMYWYVVLDIVCIHMSMCAGGL